MKPFLKSSCFGLSHFPLNFEPCLLRTFYLFVFRSGPAFLLWLTKHWNVATMDVVSPELNSLLPDEIMDTEAIEDISHPQPDSAAVQTELSEDTPVPMETDTPVISESLSLCSGSSSTEHTQILTTSTDSACSQHPISIPSMSSPQLSLKTSPSPSTSTTTSATRTTDSLSGSAVSTSGLQKLTAPFTISPANHQIILNKVASSQATEAAKTAGTQVIKQEGQKLLVTAIGKSGQPIVLQLPHTGNKPSGSQTLGEAKPQTTQFKVVTISGRSELKPVVASAGNQLAALQAQQLKTVQVYFLIILMSFSCRYDTNPLLQKNCYFFVL